MKLYIFIFCGLITSIFYAQEQPSNLDKNGEWFVNSYFGTVTIEAEDSFKVNGNVAGGTVGREFILNENFSLLTGIEHLRSWTDFQNQNQQIFLKNNYIKIPINFKLGYLFSEKTSAFAEVGVYGGYLYTSKVEIISENFEDREKGLGFNFGLHAGVGIKHQLNEYFSMSLGFISQGDFATTFDDDTPEYKLSDLYAYRLSAWVKL
ncbi:outer membrane beta-barrel protein [Aequorivita echinoideorum]|uniref:Outer membrane protein beta-barrel domain-containing protein n=1 Tax=Aequorivita echinoideorum TaxID=1549647 RepID=A0ABS5S6Q1_9FLAO|nr:outer membrane beta-barrel protein [Aequorivita echinoideorum]MBT0608859.1 hypothetical protein [Aequorivita echinoideorum]